jgi:hypothetical protein
MGLMKNVGDSAANLVFGYMVGAVTTIVVVLTLLSKLVC